MTAFTIVKTILVIIVCLVNFLQLFRDVVSFLLMPQCLPDEPETRVDNFYELEMCVFPAVSLNGLSLGNDSVEKVTRPAEEVNGEPVAVVAGHVGRQQVGDELGERWSCCIAGVALLGLLPFLKLLRTKQIAPVLSDNLKSISPPEQGCLVQLILRGVHCKEAVSVR